MFSGSIIWSTTRTPCYHCDHGHLHDQYQDQYKIIATSKLKYFLISEFANKPTDILPSGWTKSSQ